MDTTTSLEDAVKEIIESFTEEFTPFTSLDVSNAVKEKGIVCRHRDVATAVRKLFFQDTFIKDQEYIKSNVIVRLPGGDSATAYLYHHETTSTDEYVNRAQIAVTPGTPSPSLPTSSDPVDSVTPRRSLTDAIASARNRVRNSIHDIAGRAQTVISRHGPRDRSPQDEFDLENVEQQAASVETHAAARRNAITPAPTRAAAICALIDAGGVRYRTTKNQKSDCRLEIPPLWVSDLGCAPQSPIVVESAVYNGAPAIKISPNAGNRTDGLTLDSQFVSRDGRFRLSKRALDRSNVNHGPLQERTIILLDNSIIVY